MTRTLLLQQKTIHPQTTIVIQHRLSKMAALELGSKLRVPSWCLESEQHLIRTISLLLISLSVSGE